MCSPLLAGGFSPGRHALADGGHLRYVRHLRNRRLRGRPIEPALSNRMRDAMVNRGPDDAGTQVLPYVGLGHRRLSIIDLSPRGRQPMTNEDGSIWLVFNGEIYDFEPLRQQLVDGGPPIRERLRFRGARPRLRAMGHRGPGRAHERHVRVRASGTRRGASCTWCGIGSARSRSTTGGTPAGLSSRRS